MNLKSVQIALSGIIAAIALTATAASQTWNVASVTLTADQPAGPCPATVTFTGMITTGMLPPMGEMVHYQFIRSDGATSRVDSAMFGGGPAVTVTTTWTLGGSYTGWMALRVLRPNAVESSHANFTIDCSVIGKTNIIPGKLPPPPYHKKP